MINITETAKLKFTEYVEAEEPGHAIRLAIAGRGPHGFMYDMMLVPADDRQADDTAIDCGAFSVLIDKLSLENLDGSTVDYVEDESESGFKVDNPNPLWRDPRGEQIQQVLNDQINPGIASHGGFVALLDIKDDIAYVQMGGGCQGCGMAAVTLKEGVEVEIKKAVPSITQVLDTTDHASGTNPYYKPSKG